MLLVRVRVPLKHDAAAVTVAAVSALLPETVLLVRVRVPKLDTPPPPATVITRDGAVGQGGRTAVEHAAAGVEARNYYPRRCCWSG